MFMGKNSTRHLPLDKIAKMDHEKTQRKGQESGNIFALLKSDFLI